MAVEAYVRLQKRGKLREAQREEEGRVQEIESDHESDQDTDHSRAEEQVREDLLVREDALVRAAPSDERTPLLGLHDTPWAGESSGVENGVRARANHEQV